LFRETEDNHGKCVSLVEISLQDPNWTPQEYKSEVFPLEPSCLENYLISEVHGDSSFGKVNIHSVTDSTSFLNLIVR
jgi:hypothetical protein